jgi:hypothetical protein
MYTKCMGTGTDHRIAAGGVCDISVAGFSQAGRRTARSDESVSSGRSRSGCIYGGGDFVEEVEQRWIVNITARSGTL